MTVSYRAEDTGLVLVFHRGVLEFEDEIKAQDISKFLAFIKQAKPMWKRASSNSKNIKGEQ